MGAIKKKTRGGVRKGAGRPKGSKNASTLMRERVEAAYRQRVLQQADTLFNAQLQVSIGSVQIFRVDETKEGKKIHTLVTDPDEIKEVLDEGQGEECVVGGNYYFVTEIMPNPKAIEDMLNRGIGKPADNLNVTTTAADDHFKQAVENLLKNPLWTRDREDTENLLRELKPELVSSEIN